jgi:hypothetical protein
MKAVEVSRLTRQPSSAWEIELTSLPVSELDSAWIRQRLLPRLCYWMGQSPDSPLLWRLTMFACLLVCSILQPIVLGHFIARGSVLADRVAEPHLCGDLLGVRRLAGLWSRHAARAFPNHRQSRRAGELRFPRLTVPLLNHSPS